WRVKWTPAAFCHAKSVPLFWKCWLLFPQDALFATATFIRATSSSPTKGRASSIGSMRRSAIPSPTWLARPSFCWDILKAAASMRTKKIGVTLFHRTYLHHYMATVPDRWREYEQWLIVAAAARLAEGIAAERSWLVSTVRNGLAKGQ